MGFTGKNGKYQSCKGRGGPQAPQNKEQGKAPEQGRTSGEKTQAWHVRTDETGSFSAFLPAREAGGPYTLRVEDEAGEWLERKHLLIGDVWYCSGQSNMELPVSWVAPYYEEEIKNCENPYIRSFKIVEHADFHGPLSEPLSGKWKPANPKNVLDFPPVPISLRKKMGPDRCAGRHFKCEPGRSQNRGFYEPGNVKGV